MKHPPTTRSRTQPGRRSYSTPLTLLLLITGTAIATRLAAVIWLSDTVPYSDYFYYHEAGRYSAADFGFWFDRDRVLRLAKLSWWPPGYPMFLGFWYAIFGANHRVAVFLQVLLGALTALLVFRFGARISLRLGFASAMIVALNPLYVFMTNLTASENLFVVPLMLGVGLASVPRTGPKTLALAGVMLAFATLTRSVAVGVPLVVAAWLWWQVPARPQRQRRIAWLLAAYFLTLAPWTLRNAVVVGSPALASHGGGLNLYFGNNPDQVGYRDISDTPLSGIAAPGDVDRRALQLALRCIADDPLAFFRRIPPKFAELFGSAAFAMQANNAILVPRDSGSPEAQQLVDAARARQRVRAGYLNGFLAALATVYGRILAVAAAVALLLWRRMPAALRLIALLCVYWLVTHMLFWAQPRFRYPMEMFFALLAVFAVDTLGRASWKRFRSKGQPDKVQA